MVIYLSPAADAAHTKDLVRLEGAAHLSCIVLNDLQKVRMAVHLLSSALTRTLLLPDDYHRHNEAIEHVKACALHMGVQMMPVSRYLTTMPAPRPGQHDLGGAIQTSSGAGCGLAV